MDDKLIQQLYELDLFAAPDKAELRGRKDQLKQLRSGYLAKRKAADKQIQDFLGISDFRRGVVSVQKLKPLLDPILALDPRLSSAVIKSVKQGGNSSVDTLSTLAILTTPDLQFNIHLEVRRWFDKDDIGDQEIAELSTAEADVTIESILNLKTRKSSSSYIHFREILPVLAHTKLELDTSEDLQSEVEKLKTTLDRVAVPKGESFTIAKPLDIAWAKEAFIITAVTDRRTCSMCGSSIPKGDKLFFWSAGSQSGNIRICKNCANQLPSLLK